MSTRSKQPLPPKELALFRKTVRCYEQKQYKQALRCTKQILSNPNFSEHGGMLGLLCLVPALETMCMRGLILNCIGKHEEAMDVVRKGLKSDIMSYVCWHVYGQVHRSDKQYDQAMKAYKRALSLDPENLQILRDLSLLQIQMRDYLGYRESRYQLLALRLGNKAHWVAYANACHMLGDFETALKVVDELLNSLKNNEPERADLIQYRVSILQEAGRLQEALDYLEENAALIPDRLTYLEVRAELQLKLAHVSDARKLFEFLLKRNPDNVDYMKRVEDCISLLNADTPDKTNEDIKQFYANQIEANPKTRVLQIRLLLNELDEDEFRKGFVRFLVNGLRSGLPSLFTSLSVFYKDPSRMKFVEIFLNDFVRKSENLGYEKASLDGSALPELPSTIVWVLHYLAQHLLNEKRFDEALVNITKAINHTPTLVDLYMLRARILKKKGDLKAAAEEMDQTQSLDTADRYLNCLATRYLLKAGRIGDGSKMCQRFTREGMKSDDALQEMQCLWYAWACAKAYRANGELGEALKRCHQIERTVTSFYEEQYDFHTYCVRKCYMAPYVSMLHYLDSIHSNKYYVKAAQMAAEIYLQLHEHPGGEPPKPDADVAKDDTAALSQADLRKLRRKQNKQRAQEEQDKREREQQNLKEKTQKKRLDAEGDVVEGAPLDPKKLVETKTPLEDAAKFVQPVVVTGTDCAAFYKTAARLYLKKEKPLLVLKCIKRLVELDAKDASQLAKQLESYVASAKSLPPPTEKSLKDLLPQVLADSAHAQLAQLDLKN